MRVQPLTPLNMNTLTASDFLSRKRQVILDEIASQKEMLSFWGHIAETAKNIQLRISELEKSLEDLNK
jgi:siroheme synthase (precorrin-2 oxidase/ferrochelatase)